MLTNMSRAQAVGTWITIVALTMVASLIAGAPLTDGAVVLWLIAVVAPTVVTLLLWHAPPDTSVADVLYPARSQSKSIGRRS